MIHLQLLDQTIKFSLLSLSLTNGLLKSDTSSSLLDVNSVFFHSALYEDKFFAKTHLNWCTHQAQIWKIQDNVSVLPNAFGVTFTIYTSFLCSLHDSSKHALGMMLQSP